LDLKSSFQSSFLAGDSSAAEDALAQIESELGVSFFLLETRLAFLQLAKGLEQQKRYLAQIQAESTRGITPYVAYHLSQKNEFATNPISFPERFASTVNRSSYENGLDMHLLHRVVGIVVRLTR
jgi:hypothetical protein